MHAASPSTPPPVVVGIFVGGRGRRMGGRDKAGLPAPDGGTLLSRQVALGRALGFEVVIVGRSPAVEALSSPPPVLTDDPPGIGPLGGLGPALRHAGTRPLLALACDMPHVEAAFLRRLLVHAPDAAVVAPRVPDSERFMPLCARYGSAQVLPALVETLAAGERALQALLRRVAVEALPLGPGELRMLSDWDTPDDLARDAGGGGPGGSDAGQK